jgi:formylglycine-generating enzyme required for sulfatase activity
LAVAVVVALVVVASLLVFVPWAGIFRANTSSDSADRASLTNSSSEDASGKSSSAGSSQGSATAVGPNQIVMDLGKGVTMKLVRIPAQGKTFWMGTSLGDGKPEEKPQHEVEFSHDYWLGEFVVTQAQFKLFDLPRYAKSKPTRHFSADGAGAAAIKDVKDPDQLPADSVNWFEARDYCAELTKRFKAELGFEFRLPTEAEWEYACRAGDNRKDTSDYYLKSGPTRTKPLGTVNTKQSNLMRTSVQGEFPESVNAFGLWDMHGNVVQWCQDYFDVDFYKHSPRVDPVCEAAGARLVMRGSSWQDDDCRASDRHARGLLPDYGDPWKGFRVCAVRVDK